FFFHITSTTYSYTLSLHDALPISFSPDSTFRWMGSIAMDKVGNIAVGYSASSSTIFPSLRYTGRLASDPLGTLEAENTIKAGTGDRKSTRLNSSHVEISYAVVGLK